MAVKRFISWNVNGIRACLGKDFYESFAKLDADIFCLQETKVQPGQVELQLDGYHQYWNYAERKGYSGTAVFSKEEPLSVAYGIGIPEHDTEGRVITLEFADYYFITVYVPNSRDGLVRLDYRMEWEDAFLAYIRSLDEKKPVIYCGDLNVAHKEIDLKNPKTNRRNPGFTDEERDKFSAVLGSGFIDSFRYFYPASRISTAGGPTASRRGRRTWGGGSTISSSPTSCVKISGTQKYTPKCSAPTIALSSWISNYKGEQK